MHAKNTKPILKNIGGFTLVELMIALFLTAIAVVAIYRGYTSFSQSADAQEQIIELQQNLRIGMLRLEKDLRRAGMNEETDETAGFICADPFPNDCMAAANTIKFTMDLGGIDPVTPLEVTNLSLYEEGDGDEDDLGEHISYARRGPNNQGAFGLYRNDENFNPGGTGNEIISNLDVLNFVYLDEDENVIAPGAGTALTAPQRALIHSVQVSMVVRTTNEDYRHTDDNVYQNINPAGPEVILPAQGDNFRRRVLSKQIKIRNAGL